MTRYVSILRGINVGGKSKILMADLRRLYKALGFFNAVTYIQSGNVIFNFQEENCQVLALKISNAIEKAYGFSVPVIVRTVEEIARIVSGNPFLEGTPTDIERLHLTFLQDIPTAENTIQIKQKNVSPDAFSIVGNDVFVYCSGKYSDSKLTNQFFESKLKTTATTRNWKTVVKLLALTTAS